MREEEILINNCPICNSRHHYSLSVERSWTTDYDDAGYDESWKTEFNRLFICPKTNKKFEASFTLSESSSSRIEKVQVIGVII